MAGLKRYSILLALIPLVLASFLNAKSIHDNHAHDLNKERIQDGRQFADRHDDDNDYDHEIILGSRQEAEEFEKLTPEQSKQRLEKLVVKIDSDKDGFVTKHELTDWVANSFDKLDVEESEDRLEEVDTNADQVVTWTEYVGEMFGLEGEKPLLDDQEEEKLFHEDRELWQAADLNGDDSLTKNEFLRFTHPEEFHDMQHVIYQHAMREKDQDGDGFIGLHEFVDLKKSSDNLPLPGEDKSKEWVEAEKDNFQQEYDSNRDGRLDKGEVLKWLAPDDVEVAKEEAEHLIESADHNADGKLSYAEIIENYDIFVGSENDLLDNSHEEL